MKTCFSTTSLYPLAACGGKHALHFVVALICGRVRRRFARLEKSAFHFVIALLVLVITKDVRLKLFSHCSDTKYHIKNIYIFCHYVASPYGLGGVLRGRLCKSPLGDLL